MKKSTSTFLKHTAQDKINRSANPAVVRASTIFFKSMQELLKHKDPAKNKRVIIMIMVEQVHRLLPNYKI